MLPEKPSALEPIIQRILTSEDPHTVLGIGQGSAIGMIKRKYHSLMAQFHPDIFNDSRATKISQKINHAYSTITSEKPYTTEHRAAYLNIRPELKPVLEQWIKDLKGKIAWKANIFLSYWNLSKKTILSLDPEFKLEHCYVLKNSILNLYVSNFLAGYFYLEEFIDGMDSAFRELKEYDTMGFANLTEMFLADTRMQEYFKIYNKSTRSKTLS